MSHNTRTLLMSVLLMLSLTGCSGSAAPVVEEKTREPVVIPLIMAIDPSTGLKDDEDVITAFNELYKGEYYADVTWRPETEDEYRTRMKRDNVTDSLPILLRDAINLPDFYKLMIHDGRLEPLREAIRSDSEWVALIGEEALEASIEEDGEIYTAPVGTALYCCSGIYWNEDLFRQAGIEEFPDTWEGFWECVETLDAAGITPLALQTAGTAWTSMLLSTASITDTQGGIDFMNQKSPQNFDSEYGYRMVETLDRLMQYTTEDALYNDYDVAYQNFVEGRTAMIPNGHWMMADIPEEAHDHIRFSPFPGNVLIGSPDTFGRSVVSSYDEEVKKGCLALLKLRTRIYREKETQQILQARNSDDPLLKDYIYAYTHYAELVPSYQVQWQTEIQERVLEDDLPKLAQGDLTVEEFVQDLQMAASGR